MSTDIVVDDSPKVLEKAVDKGVMAMGLLFPWNREYADNGFFHIVKAFLNELNFTVFRIGLSD